MKLMQNAPVINSLQEWHSTPARRFGVIIGQRHELEARPAPPRFIYTDGMLQRPSRREALRRNQARYAARCRAGIGLYAVPLTHHEIDKLIEFGYLREGEEADRAQVGAAVARLLRGIKRP